MTALEFAREQLGGDRGAHVVGYEEYRPARVAADELLDEVGLDEQRVGTARFVREPEAEEVEGQELVSAQLGELEHEPPVIGAGGKAVQQDARWPPARAMDHEHVVAGAECRDSLPRGLPGLDACRQAHREASV